jgi:hypothetical protein
MHLIYMDESADPGLHVFSALAIPADQWRAAFQHVRDFRRGLRKSDGIFVHKEFHAWEFVSGRGRLGDKIVPKGRRCQIFKDTLRLTAGLPGARLFNATSPVRLSDRAFERLLNRINRTMESWDSRAILICDEGKEIAYTRMVRRMGVYNPIASQFGVWRGAGALAKNIPIDRIIEDPFFKESGQSYFIQLVDFAAYALLRRERPVPATSKMSKYRLNEAFGNLSDALVREATRRDPEGIIRVP